ncbi:Uncharacterised protein [Mycobacteroides abscessus subsp. abscessus]|nr:Uncharacterised protein [Mycobacteroides abscessus subsp. abscessus]
MHDDGEVYWLYSKGSFFELGDGKWPKPHDADSWPVIFAPNEVGSSEHSASDGDAYDPDLDWFPLGEEPVVPRPEPTEPIGPEIWRVAGWLEEHDDGEPYEIYTPDGSYG